VIGFRDFAPKQITPTGHRGWGTFESFDHVIKAANDWITAEGINVVNIETVVLPLYSKIEPPQDGTVAGCVFVQIGNYWYGCLQFVRVWYRLPDQEEMPPTNVP
jgi:hypothetical protein